jgi:hypothetical protein
MVDGQALRLSRQVFLDHLAALLPVSARTISHQSQPDRWSTVSVYRAHSFCRTMVVRLESSSFTNIYDGANIMGVSINKATTRAAPMPNKLIV